MRLLLCIFLVGVFIANGESHVIEIEGAKPQQGVNKIQGQKMEEPKLEEPKMEEPKMELQKMEGNKMEVQKMEGNQMEGHKMEGNKVEEHKVDGSNMKGEKMEGNQGGAMVVPVSEETDMKIVTERPTPRCQQIGQPCIQHKECCSNNCLFYLGKCVSARLRGTPDIIIV